MRSARRSFSLFALSFAFVALYSALDVRAGDLGDAEWIWSTKYSRVKAPAGPLYFRRIVEIGHFENAVIQITCDDRYELFVNGKKIGAGRDWHKIDSYDLGQALTPGRNILAVHGENEGEGPAALVARLILKDKGKKTIVNTDNQWRVSSEISKGWETLGYNDEHWEPAGHFGQFGRVSPWGDQPRMAEDIDDDPKRFSPLPGFAVERVAGPLETESLVAMTFNERGEIIASREGGPLRLLRDSNHSGHFEYVGILSDQIVNCQGILALDGRVFAVGHGPAGAALYRLSDFGEDGRARKIEPLVKFRRDMMEHGPHAVVLGPDGLLYVMIGNHSGTEQTPSEKSPYLQYYDAELIEPKYEDANGHAAGIKAPGGTVVRTDQDGSFLELFCGGFRNAYDLAFNADGEAFTFDSDMEWDIGLPWYRPTRVNHMTPGAEFGWRSGWSTWPAYYFDSLPATLDIGRGSPTGLVFYNHTRFPAKYRGALFMCDWSQGRILAVTMKAAGGTYDAKSEVFLEGQPLNCSDIAVGPDGWLYFCVGGRGTIGSIFRVVSNDKSAAVDSKKTKAPPSKSAVRRAIEEPQLESAWARQAVTELRREAGNKWAPELTAIAENPQAAADNRIRALDLLQWFSPAPGTPWLQKLSADADVRVRRKATYLLGLHPASEAGPRLVERLADSDPAVRRLACESLVRSRHAAPAAKLIDLLADPNPFVAWSAARALERLPQDEWKPAVLAADKRRIFLMGAVALVTLGADRPTADAMLSRAGQLLNDKSLSISDRVDVLRVIELALYRGGFKPQEQRALCGELLAKYPTDDWQANRELVRLLVMLQEPAAAARFMAQLSADIPMEEKIHVAMYARFLEGGWTQELRSQLIQFYEQARLLEGGNSYRGYLTNAANDFLKTSSPAEQLELITGGGKMPDLVLGLVQGLPDSPSGPQLAAVQKLDGDLDGNKTRAARELTRVTTSVLARGDEKSLAYLREQFESKPQRRPDIAQALSLVSLKNQVRPADAPLLIGSLGVIEDAAARSVLRALLKFPKPVDLKPEQLRQVILLGLKLGDDGGQHAAALLEYWSGGQLAQADGKPAGVGKWQEWFRKTYPDSPDPSLPVEASGSRWSYGQLMDFIGRDAGSNGNAERGAVVFEKAQCIKCHRYGTRGEGIGPDLTNVSRRFQPKEILESVVFPSQVISDQFAAKIVTNQDGQSFMGLVGPAADGVVVLQSNGEKVTILQKDIDTIVPSKKSAMPEGLFNTLTLDEIADLFAYLAKPPAK